MLFMGLIIVHIYSLNALLPKSFGLQVSGAWDFIFVQ